MAQQDRTGQVGESIGRFARKAGRSRIHRDSVLHKGQRYHRYDRIVSLHPCLARVQCRADGSDSQDIGFMHSEEEVERKSLQSCVVRAPSGHCFFWEDLIEHASRQILNLSLALRRGIELAFPRVAIRRASPRSAGSFNVQGPIPITVQASAPPSVMVNALPANRTCIYAKPLTQEDSQSWAGYLFYDLQIAITTTAFVPKTSSGVMYILDKEVWCCLNLEEKVDDRSGYSSNVQNWKTLKIDCLLRTVLALGCRCREHLAFQLVNLSSANLLTRDVSVM